MANNPVSTKPKAPAQLTGTVRRIVPHVEAVWAEIVLDGADDFWRSIRVRNPLQNQDGSTTLLKSGNRVTVSIELARAPKCNFQNPRRTARIDSAERKGRDKGTPTPRDQGESLRRSFSRT